MKITKRQLRRIIKEEKAKLQEIGGFNLADDEAYMNAITDYADKFASLMGKMLRMGMTPDDVEEAIDIARNDNSMELQ